MEQLKRRACDRCHKQKLRCIRPGASNDEACTRCNRLKSRCVYSVPLSKGRPRTRGKPRPSHARPDPSTPQASSLTVAPNEEALRNDGILLSAESNVSDMVDLPWPLNIGWPGVGVYHADHVDHTAIPRVSKLRPPSTATEDYIRRLSELKGRLVRVYHSSSKLKAARQVRSSNGRVTDAAFESIWIMLRPATVAGEKLEPSCRAMYEVYTASQEFLDLLDHIHNLSVIPVAEVVASHPGATNNTYDQSVDPTLSWEARAEFQAKPSEVVTQRSVLECYRLLVNIYQAIVLAFRREFDQLRLTGLTPMDRVRLGLLLRCTSQFTERMQKAMQPYQHPDSGLRTGIESMNTYNVDENKAFRSSRAQTAALEYHIRRRLVQLGEMLQV